MGEIGAGVCFRRGEIFVDPVDEIEPDGDTLRGSVSAISEDKLLLKMNVGSGLTVNHFYKYETSTLTPVVKPCVI